MAHKKLDKHDLKEDTFITFVLESWEYIRENQNKFFTGLIVLVVIVAGSFWVRNSRVQARLTAEAQFSEALTSFRDGQLKSAEELFGIIEDRFGSMKEGVYASYYIGKCALLEGRNAEAIESFQKYIDKAGKNIFFMDAAMEGMATAYENERNYERAAEIYLELVSSMKTNTFMEESYLRRAADMLKLSGQKEEAIEVLERLLDSLTGTEKRDVEIELRILRG